MIRLFRRKPVQRCRTVWMRPTANGGTRPWICQGDEGDGHHCVLFVEGRIHQRPPRSPS